MREMRYKYKHYVERTRQKENNWTRTRKQKSSTESKENKKETK